MSETTDDNICWHEPWVRCPKHHPGKPLYIIYGRCRSGKRWFWTAQNGFDTGEQHGWAKSPKQALAHARLAVVEIAAGRPALAFPRHNEASQALKKLNEEKRRARPPSDEKDARPVEYLYSYHASSFDCFPSYAVRFRIVKRTAKRIFYLHQQEGLDEHGEPRGETVGEPTVGFIDRRVLETRGYAYGTNRNWRGRLYASLEGALGFYLGRERLETPTDLPALKAAMADAHPDRGGSAATFIEARRQYVEARRQQRAARL